MGLSVLRQLTGVGTLQTRRQAAFPVLLLGEGRQGPGARLQENLSKGPHSPFSPRWVGGLSGNIHSQEAAQTLGKAHSANFHLCGLGPVTLSL